MDCLGKHVRVAAGNSLVSLARSLTPEQRVKAVESLIASLNKSTEAAIPLAKLIAFFEPYLRDRYSTELLTIMQNRLASTLDNSSTVDWIASHRFACLSMLNSRSMASRFQHPGCVDDLREFMLMRFEELLFHQGNSVYILVENASKSLVSPITLEKQTTPLRRISTLYDAAEWIIENWPDFDLEANQPVFWLGEN